MDRFDHEEMPAYSELTRRLGFEYNGMVFARVLLWEYEQGRSGEARQGSAFLKATEDSFGTLTCGNWIFPVWETCAGWDGPFVI